jgi:hypothetical protein
MNNEQSQNVHIDIHKIALSSEIIALTIIWMLSREHHIILLYERHSEPADLIPEAANQPIHRLGMAY